RSGRAVHERDRRVEVAELERLHDRLALLRPPGQSVEGLFDLGIGERGHPFTVSAGWVSASVVAGFARAPAGWRDTYVVELRGSLADGGRWRLRRWGPPCWGAHSIHLPG